MGSDGFESKKLGGPLAGGTGQSRLGPGEYSTGAERDPAMDAVLEHQARRRSPARTP